MIDNTVIEVLDREHGKRVIEFFKSKGVDTRDLEGVFCKADSNPTRFYGVVDGRFDHWPAFSLKGVKIITLPEYPKVMEVSDYPNFHYSVKRVVFMEKKNMFLAWDGATTLEEAEDSVKVNSWPYARDIKPKTDTWYAVLPDTDTVNIDELDDAVAIFKNEHQAKRFGREVCVDTFLIVEIKAPLLEEEK